MAFLRDHAATLRSGGGHASKEAPPLTALQRLVMGASSLLYLVCAASWLRVGFFWLGMWFCMVSALSVCGDALSGLLRDGLMQRVRVADRTVGTFGLLASVVFNSTTTLNTILSLAAVSTALLWLAKGRAVAKAEPRARWRYLYYHGMWHAYGAAVLTALTINAHGGRALSDGD